MHAGSVAQITANGTQEAVPIVKEAKSPTPGQARGSEDTESLTDNSKSSSSSKKVDESVSVKNGNHTDTESRSGKRVR